MLNTKSWRNQAHQYLYHGGVVALVGEYLASGHVPGQRKEGRVIGHEAARKDQGRLLAVQRGQLRLQLLVQHGVARDVPVWEEVLRD